MNNLQRNASARQKNPNTIKVSSEMFQSVVCYYVYANQCFIENKIQLE